MPDYRLYLLDRDSGHIQGARDIFAADDPAAIGLAENSAPAPWELWTGSRKVFRFNAGPEIASAEPGLEA